MNERDQFGPRLRREREKRGISLQEIAARTKISASFFEALERNDFSRWPGGIFRRSFLRSYAESVGVDADSVVRDCARLFPTEDEQAAAGSQVGRAVSATGDGRGTHATGGNGASDGRGRVRVSLIAAGAVATPGAVAAALMLGGPYAWAAAGIAVIVAVATAVLLGKRHRAVAPAAETPARPAQRPLATVVRINQAQAARQATASHHIANRRRQRDPFAPPPQRRRGERPRPRV